MTDEIDLLRAVCADKTDDIVRLAYADWLDEQPTGWVKCDHHSCGVDAMPGHVRVNSGKNYVWGEPRERPCPRCDGTATVPDDSRKSRAEFIRVQCELARLNPKTGWSYTRDGDSVEAGRRAGRDDNPAVERLQRRERVLARHAAAWWGIPCHEGFGKPPAGTFGCVAKRGFVSALTCTAADWLARADAIYWHPQCPRCRGDGAVRVPPPASAYQLSATCLECHGSGENPRPFPPTAMPLEAAELIGPVLVDQGRHPIRSEHAVRLGTRRWWSVSELNLGLGDDIVRPLLEAEFPGIHFTLNGM